MNRQILNRCTSRACTSSAPTTTAKTTTSAVVGAISSSSSSLTRTTSSKLLNNVHVRSRHYHHDHLVSGSSMNGPMIAAPSKSTVRNVLSYYYYHSFAHSLFLVFHSSILTHTHILKLWGFSNFCYFLRIINVTIDLYQSILCPVEERWQQQQ